MTTPQHVTDDAYLPPAWKELEQILIKMKKSKESGDPDAHKTCVSELRQWAKDNPEDAKAVSRHLIRMRAAEQEPL